MGMGIGSSVKSTMNDPEVVVNNVKELLVHENVEPDLDPDPSDVDVGEIEVERLGDELEGIEFHPTMYLTTSLKPNMIESPISSKEDEIFETCSLEAEEYLLRKDTEDELEEASKSYS
jgi:hypothetical protein